MEALAEMGWSLVELRRQGYLIVAVRLAVDYHAPARAGDTLEIATRIRDVRGARSVWAQEIREATSQRVLVTAEVAGALASQ